MSIVPHNRTFRAQVPEDLSSLRRRSLQGTAAGNIDLLVVFGYNVVVVALNGVDVHDPTTDEIHSNDARAAGQIAVKVINDYGDEVMKVFGVRD